nr:hypothetical protein [Stenotrophomonas maltophilia]
MTTDKTLADVQPGGRVRLGDAPWPEIDVILADAYSAGAEGLPFEGIARRAAVRNAIAALSAQPSPGGQRDDSPMAKMAAALRGKAEAERAAFDQRVQSGEWGPMPDNPDVLELPPLPEGVDSVRCMIRGEKGFAEPCDYYFTSKQMRDYARTALAASQPVGEPVEHACTNCDRTDEVVICQTCAGMAWDNGRLHEFHEVRELSTSLGEGVLDHLLPDEWHEKPLLRFQGAFDEGDRSVGIGERCGNVLAADQSGTVLGDYLAARAAKEGGQ